METSKNHDFNLNENAADHMMSML